MRTRTGNSPTALAYARSLLDLANERGQSLEIGRELADIRGIVESTPSFDAFLADPGISAAERTAMMDRLFLGRASPLVMNFLGVLNKHGRLRLLKEMSRAYDDLLAKQLGNVDVDVTVAQRLSDEQLEQVRQRVGQALGKNAVLHQYVDENVLGGLVLRVEDKVIDASVRYQLEAMKQQLLAARRK